MGNAIGGGGRLRRRRAARVMRLDGTQFKCRPPALAGDVLAGNPGFSLLDSDDVKRSGVRAVPLAAGAELKPGKLYFLVALPPAPARTPARAADRRSVSGPIRLTAKERLETLMLTKRSTSDISSASVPASPAVMPAASPMRVTMRLPKREVERAVKESGGDASDAARRIMEFCVSSCSAPVTPERAWGTPARISVLTPEMSPLYSPSTSPAPGKTPPAVPRRKEKLIRFTVLPEEITT